MAMATVKAFQNNIDEAILDPRFHEILVLIKAVRNGIVYGAKVRLPHALVMVFLFASGSVREKIVKILQATREHALCLAHFAFLYKLSCMILKRTNNGKEASTHSFLAGLSCGYWVFGRNRVASSSVVQQMVMYALGRVAMGLAKFAVETSGKEPTSPGQGDWRQPLRQMGWPISASLCWATVMWLFRWHPDVLQPSLRSSLTYLYVNAETWDGIGTLLFKNA